MKRWLSALAVLSLALLIGPVQAARDGSGTYTVPNTFTAGTTITAAGHNENWSDIADEITNSLPRDGQAGMTGQFKSSNGTVSLPGITFTSDPNSGIYRIAEDNVGLAIGGTLISDWSSTGLAVATGKTITIGGVDVPASVEGTWTPAVAFGGSSTGVTYAIQAGRYIKMGDLVTLWAEIELTSNGSGTGDVTITGLPFASSSMTTRYAGSWVSIAGVDDTGPYMITVGNNGSTMTVRQHVIGSGISTADEADITDTAAFVISVTYRTGT